MEVQRGQNGQTATKSILKTKVHWQMDKIHSQNKNSLANGQNPFSKQKFIG